MWKETYKLGISSIDEQHFKLFEMVEALLKAIEKKAEKSMFQDAIGFMKEYVVKHFREEEVYQESIQYPDIVLHKKAHRDFTAKVLEYEKKLIETDFDLSVLKDLAGTLTAWLIYHVADADQKLVGKGQKEEHDTKQELIYHFSNGFLDVLEKMGGVDTKQVKISDSMMQQTEEVQVCIEVIGEKQGKVVYRFSNGLAFQLIKNMTFMETSEVDEFVCSALAEIANISTGNVVTDLSKDGILCDINPPSVLKEGKEENFENEIQINTDIGVAKIALYGW